MLASAAVGLLAAYFFGPGTELEGPGNSAMAATARGRGFRRLEASRWDRGPAFAEAVSAERQPRILRGGTAIDQWPAFG